jgi:two-component system nitrogen regulation response regulator GlnG
MAGGGDNEALDVTTIEDARRARRSPNAELEVALTLVGHADLDRVGERALLGALASGGEQAISRLEPLFEGGGVSRPLADPHISRRPVVRIRFGERATTISAERVIKVDGKPIADETVVDARALSSGVTIELGESVALLLHTVDGSVLADGDDLGIRGQSAAICRTRESLRRVALHDVPVLIRGESGSGKELVARAIHRLSERSDGPFVSVNMGAIPASTAAAALFGHARGAFTGAVREAGGFFGEADGGTLFLDEVGHAPDAVQTALLRALESGEVQRVGGTTRQVDVRLVAATDAELETAVDEGAFRFPLLMRLAGYELGVPPLRARRDDVARLALHFARLELERSGYPDKLEADPPWLSAPLLAAAARFDWPGNVRQLRNVVTKLVIEHADAPQVPDDAVPMLLADAEPPPQPTRGPSDLPDDEIRSALSAHDYRVEPAARSLGVSRSALYALLRKRDIVRRASDLHVDEIRTALDRAGGRTLDAARALGVSERALQLRKSALDIE